MQRFLSVDPLASKLPGWSPYAAMADNPIMFFDPDGKFPYPIHIRSFAPMAQFGGYFDGDNRGYSTAAGKGEGGSVTSRVQQTFTVDPSAGTLTGQRTWSDKSHHPWFGDKTATPSGSTDVTYGCGSVTNSATIKANMAGANPLAPGSPDIDVKSAITITENKSKGILSVDASMQGDKFPAAEMFIGDSKGQQVMIIASPYQGNPYESLPGNNDRSMGAAQFNITINGKGEFTGVVTGSGKTAVTYTIADWNKMMTSKPLEQPKEKAYPPR